MCESLAWRVCVCLVRALRLYHFQLLFSSHVVCRSPMVDRLLVNKDNLMVKRKQKQIEKSNELIPIPKWTSWLRFDNGERVWERERASAPVRWFWQFYNLSIRHSPLRFDFRCWFTLLMLAAAICPTLKFINFAVILSRRWLRSAIAFFARCRSFWLVLVTSHTSVSFPWVGDLMNPQLHESAPRVRWSVARVAHFSSVGKYIENKWMTIATLRPQIDS